MVPACFCCFACRRAPSGGCVRVVCYVIVMVYVLVVVRIAVVVYVFHTLYLRYMKMFAGRSI